MMRAVHQPEGRRLTLFLFARALAREGFGRSGSFEDDLVAVTGLPLSTVRRAILGRLHDQAARAAIWSAIHQPKGRA